MIKGFGFGQVLDRVMDKYLKCQIVQLPNTALMYSENTTQTQEHISGRMVEASHTLIIYG